MAKEQKTIKNPNPITLNFIEEIKNMPKRTVTFLGHKIIINKQIFPVDSPNSFTSGMFAKRIPKNVGSVLDIGSGTGVLSIIAAKMGAKKVLAIDIDKNCLENTKDNIALHKLEKIVKTRKSNLFEKIKDNEKFDLIICNLPFADVDYSCEVSHFLFDPGFSLHERALKDAKKHLTKNGQILIPSGEIANEKKLLEIVGKYDYKIEKIYTDKSQGIIWKLYVLKK